MSSRFLTDLTSEVISIYDPPLLLTFKQPNQWHYSLLIYTIESYHTHPFPKHSSHCSKEIPSERNPNSSYFYFLNFSHTKEFAKEECELLRENWNVDEAEADAMRTANSFAVLLKQIHVCIQPSANPLPGGFPSRSVSTLVIHFGSDIYV